MLVALEEKRQAEAAARDLQNTLLGLESEKKVLEGKLAAADEREKDELRESSESREKNAQCELTITSLESEIASARSSEEGLRGTINMAEKAIEAHERTISNLEEELAGLRGVEGKVRGRYEEKIRELEGQLALKGRGEEAKKEGGEGVGEMQVRAPRPRPTPAQPTPTSPHNSPPP